MATIIVMVICAAAESFLLYVLTQFARELRKDRAVHVARVAIPISRAAGEKTAEGREFGKVIEIPGPSRVPSHSRDRRMAS
jgi:hypothetical protein